MKELIANTEIRIEGFKVKIDPRIPANFIFVTGSTDPLPKSADDRRFFVINTQPEAPRV